MSEPTIEQLKQLQAEHNLQHIHLVWLSPDRFVIAHTDEERATIDLEDCQLHIGLLSMDTMPVYETGYYTVDQELKTFIFERFYNE